jgi:hypothetical protein
MSRPVQATSSSKPLSIVTTREIQVQRIAKEAAALSKLTLPLFDESHSHGNQAASPR